MARTPYTGFKHRPLLENNKVFLPDSAFIQELDHAELDARLFKALPYLPEHPTEAFCTNKLLLINKGERDETVTTSLTLCRQEPFYVFISCPDKGDKVVLDKRTHRPAFVPDDGRRERSSNTREQYQSMIPFQYWHEKIEATVGMMIDPENKIDYVMYAETPALYRSMEAVADCFAVHTVISNKDLYQRNGLDIVIPLASVMGKMMVKELDRYYTPILTFMKDNPDDQKGIEGVFNKYVKFAAAQVERLLGAGLQKAGE